MLRHFLAGDVVQLNANAEIKREDSEVRFRVVADVSSSLGRATAPTALFPSS